jgi:hypothetical protein
MAGFEIQGKFHEVSLGTLRTSTANGSGEGTVVKQHHYSFSSIGFSLVVTW